MERDVVEGGGDLKSATKINATPPPIRSPLFFPSTIFCRNEFVDDNRLIVAERAKSDDVIVRMKSDVGDGTTERQIGVDGDAIAGIRIPHVNAPVLRTGHYKRAALADGAVKTLAKVRRADAAIHDGIAKRYDYFFARGSIVSVHS